MIGLYYIAGLGALVLLGCLAEWMLKWPQRRYEARCEKILPLFDYGRLLYPHEVVASCTLPRNVVHQLLERLEREGRLQRVASSLGKRYRRLF